MDSKPNLPNLVRRVAIEFAREKTGLQRPHRSQTVHIEAFEKCFETMVEMGMVKEEFINGKETIKTDS